MANNELQIAGSQGERRIRPYEHLSLIHIEMCIRDRNFLDELRVEINSKSFWTSKGSGRMTVTIGAGKYKVCLLYTSRCV